MFLLLNGTQSTVHVHCNVVSTAEWHIVYCTCTPQCGVYCWVAHSVLYVYTTVMCVLLSCTQSTVRVHYSDVSNAEWHRVLYVYTTVMCVLLSGTQSTVRLHYSDVCTAEWHTECCTCTLQWCVYCWLAYRVLYVYTAVWCLLLSGTQGTVHVHCSVVSTAVWHIVYCKCTLQCGVYCWVARSVLYVYTTVMCVLLSGTQSTVRVHYCDVCTAEWHTE
jgi:hypothetical protein